MKEALHNDTVFREIEAATIQDLTQRVVEDLDDLAVLLLFSVFEANVRERTLEEIDREMEKPPRHLVLKKAVDDARDTIEHGSFGRLTESYKELSPDVKTLVDQVRHYRNWVAHGRRGPVANNVDPDSTRTRLLTSSAYWTRMLSRPRRACWLILSRNRRERYKEVSDVGLRRRRLTTKLMGRIWPAFPSTCRA